MDATVWETKLVMTRMTATNKASRAKGDALAPIIQMMKLLVKQPAFPAQRAAAAQQQQHVPVKRPEVRHVENAAAVQHLWAQREWRRAQHCMVGVRVQHDDRDEADGAEGAEVGRCEGESAPQRCGGGEGGTRHVMLPRVMYPPVYRVWAGNCIRKRTILAERPHTRSTPGHWG